MTKSRLGPPWFLMTGLMTLGTVVLFAFSVRVGGFIMSAALLAGAGMRAAFPERYVLDIKVRSRGVDIVGYTFFAVASFLAFGLVRL